MDEMEQAERDFSASSGRNPEYLPHGDGLLDPCPELSYKIFQDEPPDDGSPVIIDA